MRHVKEHSARFVWVPALLLLLPMAVVAETFTVTLDDGSSFLSRYQPQNSRPGSEKEPGMDCQFSCSDSATSGTIGARGH